MTTLDLHPAFPVNTDTELDVYEKIQMKGFKYLTPYTAGKEFMKVACPNNHISRWLPKKAVIPCNNCKQCWNDRKLTPAERIAEIINGRKGEIIVGYSKSHLPMTILGSCGHTFCSKPDNIMGGSWCTVCPKNNIEQSKKTFYTTIANHGGKALGNYVNSLTFMNIQCSEGHIFESNPNRINAGAWCAVCAGNSPLVGKQRFTEAVAAKNGRVITQYVNNDDKVAIKCADGHIFYAAPYSITGGRWCMKCTKSCPERAHKRFLAAVEERQGQVLGEYVNTTTRVLVRCNDNHEFEAMPKSVSNRGNWCPRCSGTCPIQAKEKFEGMVKLRKGTILGEYVNTFIKVAVRCEQGHEFAISQGNAMGGKWCRACSKLESHGEREIRQLLAEWGIPFTQEASFDWLPKKRYDFSLSYNDRNFLIEYDGEQHFEFTSFFHKTEEKFEYKQDIDVMKTVEAMKHGYFIIRIAHTDFNNIRHILAATLTKPQTQLTVSDLEMYGWLLTPLASILAKE